MVKTKIATWADLCFIATISFIIFCFVIYCAPPLGTYEISINGNKVSEISIAQYWNLVNDSLKGFRFSLMIFGCGIACFIFDIFITRPFLNRYTKAGKILRAKQKEEWRKFVEEKEKQNGKQK